VRLFLPCSAMISHHLNEELFFPRIEEHQKELKPLVQDFRSLTQFDVPEIKGIGDIFSGPVKAMAEKRQQLNLAVGVMVVHGVEIFNNMMVIMSLYSVPAGSHVLVVEQVAFCDVLAPDSTPRVVFPKTSGAGRKIRNKE